MLSVLINAYACAPNSGSEPGMAWNWIINLAHHCKLHVITEGEWQTEIEEAVANLPQGKNIKFYYNPVSANIRNMCWNQGDWRFYYHYQKWQKQTLKIAEEIIRLEQIDVVHQLNMIGFREPGYLWKINKPFIWGPVDAKESFPKAFLSSANTKQRLFILLKNVITKFQLKFSPRVNRAAKGAKYVVSASTESVITFKKYFDINSILINETGCYVSTIEQINSVYKNNNFELLWVGKFDFRKQLGLALKTMALLPFKNIKLNIVGGSPSEEAYYKEKAAELNISEQCIWHGKIQHSQVQQLMQTSHIFFFTSVAEGTPHVVLEALSNKLPVLCFNTCGQGDSVNDKVGIKIEFSNPERSVKEFANQIEYLYYNQQVLNEMAANCYERQKELSWESKAIRMVELYNKSAI